MSKRLLVITNSKAGSADKDALNEALDVLREQAWVEVRGTSSPEELSDALADAHGRTIVVAGGDGSLHAVVQSLHDRGELATSTLALLPMGTGNDFARTLDIPRRPKKAAEVVLTGTPRPIDVIVDDREQITVNNVHIGAGAEAGEEGARWKKRLHKVGKKVGVGGSTLGKLGYPLGTLKTAIYPPMLRLRVEIDGKVVAKKDEEILMIAVGNGASVGGGTPVTPDADPSDGLADILVVTAVSTLDQLKYLVRLPLGIHDGHTDSKIIRGRSVKVKGEPFDCNSDGEIDGPVTAREWRVEPAAYSMVLPVD
ncbi:lipid kinase [Nocardioides maradonensis]